MKFKFILIFLWTNLNFSQVVFAQTLENHPPRINLPNLGEEGSYSISPIEEKRIRYQLIAELERGSIGNEKILADEIPRVLVGKILNLLDVNNNFVNYIVADNRFNASANVGGVILTNVGLWSKLDTVTAFTGVLAHEIVHLNNKHIARLFSQASKQQWLGLLATIIGIAAVDKNVNAANAIIYSGQAIPLRSFLAFSREMEDEADRNAITILTNSGFPPSAMIEAMKVMSLLNDTSGEQMEFLRTHPYNNERLSEAISRNLNINNPNAVNSKLINQLQREYDLIKLFIVDDNTRVIIQNKILENYKTATWRDEFSQLFNLYFNQQTKTKLTSPTEIQKITGEFAQKIISDQSLSELELTTLISYLVRNSKVFDTTVELYHKNRPQNITLIKQQITNWLLENTRGQNGDNAANITLANKIINSINFHRLQNHNDFAQFLAYSYQTLNVNTTDKTEKEKLSNWESFYLAKSLFAKGNIENALAVTIKLSDNIKTAPTKFSQYQKLEIAKMLAELEEVNEKNK